ncbi:MAG TPA: aminotransferase class V-fold PLP-dependent enzyme [Actinomycetota bacterium]|nr:aminotransferase class V-fold PLP-dependent enzyme [Actinomycetota bacterium]
MEEALEAAIAHADEYLRDLPARPVGWTATVEELRAALGGDLPDEPIPAVDVIAEMVKGIDGGIVGTSSPRYFGFVIGGGLPVTIAADWLTTVWDQNHGLYAAGPGASVIEETAGGWLKDLLGVPRQASFALVTGCQMAHFVCLAAARHHILRELDWDVETDGLQGAPRVTVVAGAERHVTIDRALRYLGLGTSSVREVAADGQGRMDPGSLNEVLKGSEGPTIVCAQAGNVNTGSFDPLDEICDAAHAAGAWVHVDGAFGLWAAAAPSLRHLTAGSDKADSWATDAHKWLNVPYDSGLAFCAHPEPHRAALSVHADYLIQSSDRRDPMDWTPEFSRRARSFAVYAALRSLGRSGVAEMIERCCANARRFAEKLGSESGIHVLNEVVLNQVLVSFGSDARTRAVVEAVQRDGTCWLSGSVWHGQGVMRISVSNWATTAEDVDLSVEAILRCAREVTEN